MKDEEREIDNCLIMRIKKLKEQVKNLIQQVIGSCILAFTKNKREKQDEQLTKAKEIIENFLKEFERLDVLCNYQLRTQAEQFLKEIE